MAILTPQNGNPAAAGDADDDAAGIARLEAAFAAQRTAFAADRAPHSPAISAPIRCPPRT